MRYFHGGGRSSALRIELASFLIVACAACGSSSEPEAGTPPTGNETPRGVETVPGPDFGKEGEPYCPSLHFCLERPRSSMDDLNDVATGTVGDLWAVGNRGTILHSNSRGALWARVHSPTSANLRSVSIADGVAWMVGDEGAIVRVEGTSLELVPSGTKANLEGVWAVSSTQAWAVGTSEVDGKRRGLVLRFDGHAWFDATVGELVPLHAVHGSVAGEPWIAGGNLEPAAYRFDGKRFAPTGLSGALSPEAEGPIRSLLVRASGEVFATSDGVNFNDVFYYDGSSWSVDLSWRSDRLGSNFAKIWERSDGSIVTTADPPIVRTSARHWAPLDSEVSHGAGWRAMAESGSTIALVGEGGFTAQWGTQEAGGPFGRMIGTAFDGVAYVASQDGVWARRGDELRPILTRPHDINNIVLFDALAANNVLASSWIFSTGQYAEPTELSIVRYDGKSTNVLVDDKTSRRMLAAIAAGSDGTAYTTQLSADSSYPLYQLVAGAQSPKRVQCDGQDVLLLDHDTMQSTPLGVVVRTADMPSNNYLVHAGTCSPLPAFSWLIIAADGQGGLMTLARAGQDNVLGQFDGQSWRELTRFETPELPSTRQWIVFSASDVLIVDGSVSGATILHYDGHAVSPLIREPLLQRAAIWGTDRDHLWIGDDGGHILRYKP